MNEEREALEGRVWTVTTEAMPAEGLEAPIRPLGWRQARLALATLCVNPPDRRSDAPVGTPAWLRILGSGVSEELQSLLHERDRASM